MTTHLLVAAAVATLLTFVLALAESAVGRLSRVRAQELADEGRPGSGSLTLVMGDVAGYISTTTFLRVVAEATIAVCVTVAVGEHIDSGLQAVLVAVAVMAVVSFVLTGVSPRTLGAQHADRVALAAAPALVWIRRLLGPLSRLLVTLGNSITPGRGFVDGPFESEAELRDLVDMARETEVIESDERDMIHSVFELGDTVARECMVPRTDMVVLGLDHPLRHAMSHLLRSGFSRMPVIGDDTDDVRGVVYLKDVARRLNAAPQDSDVTVEQIMRPAQFVPDSKPVDDLLRAMQAGHNHVAILVDEYGGTAGLITIEDIIEEIVGEIEDEYDREQQGIEEVEGGLVRIPATMNVDDFAQEFDVDLEEEDVDTVGGLIAKTIGEVPLPGSSCEVLGLRLTAERPSGRRHRIATVLVEVIPTEDPDDDALRAAIRRREERQVRDAGRDDRPGGGTAERRAGSRTEEEDR